MVKSIMIDVVGVAGLGSLFYGLHAFDPSLAFSVIGMLLIAYSIKADSK